MIVRKDLGPVVKSYVDLNDPKFRITSKVGTTGELSVKKLLPKAHYVSFETEEQALMEVINRKADVFVFDAPYNYAAMKLFPAENLIHIEKPFTYEPLAWAIRQGDVDFLNWLNNFLNQIKQDGTYDRLHRKWFLEDAWITEIKK